MLSALWRSSGLSQNQLNLTVVQVSWRFPKPRRSFRRLFSAKVKPHPHSTQSAETEQKLKIFVKDLNATLEAHRQWNRSNAFRYEVQYRDLDPGGKLPKQSVDGRIENTGDLSRRIKDEEIVRVEHERLESGDYEGQVQSLKAEWKVRGDLDDAFHRPWLLYSPEEGIADGMKGLSQELEAFEAYISLTETEEAMALMVLREVGQVLGPKYSVSMCGSRMRGLASPLSDIDIHLSSEPSVQIKTDIGAGLRIMPNNKSMDILMLRRAINTLTKRKIAYNYDMRYGRVPVCRADHTVTGLPIELKCLAPAAIQDDIVADYMMEIPHLRPVFMAVRQSLQMRGMMTVFDGGIGSYSLFMMVAGALKFNASKLKDRPLGESFLTVLRFWIDFDYYNQGLMLDPPQMFGKREALLDPMDSAGSSSQLVCIDKMQRFEPDQPFLMCLQDPADFANDLGRKSHAIKHLQATLQSLHQDVTQFIQHGHTTPFQEAARRSMLAPILQGDYLPMERQRSYLEWLSRSRSNRISEMSRPLFLGRRGKPRFSDQELKDRLQKRAKVFRSGTEKRKQESQKRLNGLIKQYQTRSDSQHYQARSIFKRIVVGGSANVQASDNSPGQRGSIRPQSRP